MNKQDLREILYCTIGTVIIGLLWLILLKPTPQTPIIITLDSPTLNELYLEYQADPLQFAKQHPRFSRAMEELKQSQVIK